MTRQDPTHNTVENQPEESNPALDDKRRAHLELRGAYAEASNARALELANCEKEDPARAFTILDEIRTLFVGRDPDGWVDRSLRAARSHILMQSQRYEEAVTELRSLTREPDQDLEDYLVNQRGLAISLEKLGRPAEALAELEAAVAATPNVNPARVFPVLVLYAKVAERNGQTISASYLPVFLASASALGIDVEEALRNGGVHHAVLDADQRNRAAHRRYDRFVAALRSAPVEQRDSMIEAYAEEESVGQFRELAQKARENWRSP